MPNQKPMIPRLPKWGDKPQEKHDVEPNYLGVVNDILRDEAGASSHLTIEVRGIRNSPPGTYKLAYRPGTPLGDYLKRVKLKYIGITNAVYDHTNLARGRCRMSYVPKEGAKIVIGHRDIGPAFSLQRTTVDAQQLATNMGKVGNGPAPRIVEVKKR